MKYHQAMMDHDDVMGPDRDNVFAMYHDHKIMMDPGEETVTDHDHGITMGHDDGALTVRNGVTIMDRGHVNVIRRVGETVMDPTTFTRYFVGRCNMG